MKQYNFDEIIERRNTGALKTDILQARYGNSDLLPLWVADMDFRSCEKIIEAMQKRCEHGIFGYPVATEAYYLSIINWLKNEHQWTIQQKWLSYIPGIVKGIAFAVMHFSNPNDKIIIQPPVYHPFRMVTQMHHRQVVNNPLIEENGRYRMDLDGLRKLIDKDCKLLILANPHNPVGITWDKETLKELAGICYENHILVIADEIHADMAIFGNRHFPFATVSEQAEQNSITFMSPSKTFNIAGIVSSYAIVPNDSIRQSFYTFLEASELGDGTIFAYTAIEAAYNQGKEWKDQMLHYVEANIRFVDAYVKEHIPAIQVIIPEASFLVWLDCRALGLNQKELNRLFTDQAQLALNDGEMFGKEGIGFMRLNVGCPRSILDKALKQLAQAVHARK
ncbi:Cystathionine beta-lyase PatB [termite gut metagenome]|uniref:cysteine-S-conjugate beta-lyase n=1 Tax=termite gut metagenome TaxID=433724 RepID=A0A5J4T082_9ZZZZ